MNVFDITAEHAALIAEIEENGGEITPEIAERLNINEENLATKVRAYYHIIKMTEGQITVAKDEQARLKTVRDVKENLITRLKKAVDLAVEEFGVVKPKAVNKSLDLGDLKVWQKKTEALEINNIIDDERFCTNVITITLPYKDTPRFYELIKDFDFSNGDMTADFRVDNAKLKDFVIDNEAYLKELKKKASEITEVDFEGEVDNQKEIKEETQEDIDTTIALATNLKHNSTVIFK